MKYLVRTYGCQMNVADSSEMARHLQARGVASTDNPEEASIILVNTCTVRHHAEERGFSEVGRLRKWKASQPGRKVVVTGCAAERTKDHLESRFPFIDLIVGAKSIEDFPDMIEKLLDRRPTDDDLDYAIPSADGEVSAFVTIMRGCNYSCTYCIVPSVRGREKYHSMDEILTEVRHRVREGAREITLLGQTVNSYHMDGTRGRDSDFADLLESVSRVDGVERIRFMSPHPHYMTDRVIAAMRDIPEVCEGLHLPVQSGSTPVLRRMQRNYSREEYLQLVEKLRIAMPDITISTDIIVGFPGETEEDFRETLSLVNEAQFDWGFLFKYSSREGTAAAKMADLPEELIEQRHQECLAVMDRVGERKRAKLLGTEQQVLVEEDGFGRTRGNYKVRIDGDSRPGDLLPMRITNVDRATLEASRIPVEQHYGN